MRVSRKIGQEPLNRVMQRRRLEQEQQALLDEIIDETPESENETVLLWMDARRLRGLPAVGRGVAGVVTESYVPGSDEHVDEMDAA